MNTVEFIDGGAPGISAALMNEPFHIKVATYDSETETITVTIGHGRADFGGGEAGIVEKLADETITISPVQTSTTYFIFLDKNASPKNFSYATASAPAAGQVLLGSVTTGATELTIGDLTREDLRGIMPGCWANNADNAAKLNNVPSTGFVKTDGTQAMTGSLTIANAQTGIILKDTDGAAGQGLTINWQVDDHPGVDLAQITGVSDTNGGYLSFKTNNADTGTPAERMTIGSDGKVTVEGVIESNVATGTAPFIVDSSTKVINLHADKLDGCDVGNDTGNIPVSNGTKCVNLNADSLNGYHDTAFVKVDGTQSMTGSLTIASTQTGITLQDTDGTTDQGLPINWQVGDHVGVNLAQIVGVSDNAGGHLSFKTNNADTTSPGPVERMKIGSDGKVTVGGVIESTVTNGTAPFIVTSSTKVANLTANNLIADANQDIGDYNFRAKTIQSDVATGTAPLIIASTTKVANLTANNLISDSNQDIGDYDLRAKSFTSDVPTGTPPFTVSSSTKVANLTANNLICDANQDIGDYDLRAKSFTADVPTGTAPFIVSSSTKVANLTANNLIADANVDIGSYELRAQTLQSDVATGTTPLIVASTTKVTNLNVDKLDGYDAGNALGNIPVSNGTVCTNLNADKLDNNDAGNASGNIPISNGTKCVNLNADSLDGLHDTAFVKIDGTQSMTGSLTINPTAVSGIQSGIVLKDAGSGSGEGLTIGWQAGDHSGVNLAQIAGVSDTAGGYLLFKTNSADTASPGPVERMKIGSDGKVTVGGVIKSNVTTGTAPFEVTSTTEVANLKAATATNLAGGSIGQIPYQSATNTTLFLTAGTSGQVLISGGAGAPTWTEATDANTANAIVKRNGGNFSAGTITANLTGNVTGNVTGNCSGSSGSCTGNAATATVANGILETGTGALTIHKKVIQIGDWNMDANSNATISHQLTISKIIGVEVFIRNDYSDIYPLNHCNSSTGVAGGTYTINSDPPVILLSRVNAGVFDNVSFDSTSYNRGYIIIEYTD